MKALSRRALLRVGLALGATTMAAGCAQPAAPESAPAGLVPTTAPEVVVGAPSETPAAPAPTPSATTRTAAATTAVATASVPTAGAPVPTAAGMGATAAPAQEAGRAAGWEDLVVAAQREGGLSLVTLVNRGWSTVMERFERAFPGVAVRRLAESSATVWWDAVRQGRAAGRQAYDLAFVQPGPALAGAGEGVWAPVRPLLLRPDVLDDRAWRGGLRARFLDDGGALCFDWEHQVHHAYLVKTDMVGEGEIRSARDLLDPKWRGSVLSSDPRTGNALTSAAAVAKAWGNDVLRRLLVEQRPAFITSNGWSSDLAIEFARGKHPIAQGLRPKPLAEARSQGLGQNLRYLDLPDADFVPSTALLYLDRAPHPAAARLFANWILTQEGQTLLTRSLPTNSARTDVTPFEPDGIGAIGNTYYEPDATANEGHARETARFVREILGR